MVQSVLGTALYNFAWRDSAAGDAFWLLGALHAGWALEAGHALPGRRNQLLGMPVLPGPDALPRGAAIAVSG
jgi:hypothetical protein